MSDEDRVSTVSSPETETETGGFQDQDRDQDSEVPRPRPRPRLVKTRLETSQDQDSSLENSKSGGYSIQVRWESVQAIDVKFSQDFTHQKSLKSVNC